ncbi:hypothetical protein [Mycolicibacterium llatzerense]|uniref:hypothetical protein n=1 Tax=Mycolicibacterium llatzerense TaxID=280871 RepID=UPI0021B509CF|nr:hypothetical protein [Mycolicibacterium llatzerense]MCT7372933.1 hypothetical protein [Mycolicibacterium llatzerense]
MSEDSETYAPTSPSQAAETAARFLGVFPGVGFELADGKVWRLPMPSYMPPKMKRRYLEHLRFMSEDLDKEKVSSRDPITDRLIEREQVVWPLRFNKKLIDEDELLCVALMADDSDDEGQAARDGYFKDCTLPDTYEQFLAAGGVPGQVQVHWRVMNLQMEERIKSDPKSR